MAFYPMQNKKEREGEHLDIRKKGEVGKNKGNCIMSSVTILLP
jgi:hypothetical protein